MESEMPHIEDLKRQSWGHWKTLRLCATGLKPDLVNTSLVECPGLIEVKLYGEQLWHIYHIKSSPLEKEKKIAMHNIVQSVTTKKRLFIEKNPPTHNQMFIHLES